MTDDVHVGDLGICDRGVTVEVDGGGVRVTVYGQELVLEVRSKRRALLLLVSGPSVGGLMWYELVVPRLKARSQKER